MSPLTVESINRCLVDDHPQLTTALQNLSSLSLRRGPWSKGAQHLLSWGQEACRTLPSVTFWTLHPFSGPPCLHLPFDAQALAGSSFGSCVRVSWHSSHCSIPGTLPDPCGSFPKQQEKSYPQIELQDSVALLILGPPTQHTPLAWLLGVIVVPTGQCQHYCSRRGSRAKCRDKAGVKQPRRRGTETSSKKKKAERRAEKDLVGFKFY